ncbi:hypothetical protein [Nannocystis radixulma]|uniref:Uncharacterized protein n=1 Tax=Nannocystis radixulma TaxID=2995305 RepID=A0ABT5BLV8_9BACT|nr:hypothetical protein [Nannocystis radixulma]MDC0675148.1 hypothetical protein [Nannocystis radixulma]
MRTSSLAPLIALGLVACQDPAAGSATDDASTSAATTEMSPTTGSTEHVPTTSSGSSGSTAAPAECDGCAADEACIGGICEAVGRADIEAGCHPLGDPGGRVQCVYPWPSNFYTAPDAASTTGLKVALPGTLLPKNTQQTEFPVEDLLNGSPGFTPNAQIRFATATPIDGSSLPPIDDIGRSLADEAPIVLLALDSGERWPYFAEVDATGVAGEPQTIFIRPMRQLRTGTRYVVAVRGLRDKNGEEIPASPLFRALRDELTTDVPQLEAERERYDELFAALAEAGVDRGSLQQAWDFTTNTEAAMQRDFLAIQPQVAAIAETGDLGYTIEEVSENPGSEVPLVVRGTFTVPSCLTDDSGPGTVFARDPMGLPDCSNTATANFWIAVPQAIYEAQTPAPVAVYGHGLLGSGAEAESVAKKNGSLIMAGTDFWGMSEDDIAAVIGMLGNNFVGGRTLGERLVQSTVNFTTLAYLAQGALVDEPALQGLIDPSVVYYIGGSQGGIMGATVTAMAPEIRRGVLVVGASNYSLMVWRSTAFDQVNSVWAATQPSTQNREFLFALYQAVFDVADPLTYRSVIETAGDSLLLIESIGDAQVANIASEAMARSYGMTMAAPPVYPVWGLEDAPPMFTGSALLQVDTKNGPLPPLENLPADGDNGAHGAAVDDPAVQAILGAFLLEGIVDNTCDGACDPN